MLIIAIFDALIAQFYFDSLPFEFKFSISVAILPIYYYFDRTLNPIKTGMYVMTVGLLFRTVTQANLYGSFSGAFWGDFPFIYFDLFYGIIFYFLYTNSDKKSMSQWAMVAVFGDWAGNTIEAVARYGPSFIYTSNSTMIFFIVACIRVLISIGIVLFLNHYSRLIRKDEHEIRYKQLLMLTSELKSEAYFIQKNMDYIEYVMSDAYTLYSELDDLEPEDTKRIALKIATDIHEIKKNYSRVVDGLGKITDGEVNFNQMKITELVKILRYSITRYLETENSEVQFVTNVHSSKYVKEHYLIMSVLRNLVNNAVEELMKNNNHGTVKLKYQENPDYYIFTISDNGRGIDEKDIDYIFETGFSTKFNEETGNICRGVGLALVKEIVEQKLNGRIDVKSVKNVGTDFYVYIDKNYAGG
jgi:two-component system sensor histidine kinase YcbA